MQKFAPSNISRYIVLSFHSGNIHELEERYGVSIGIAYKNETKNSL